jgi:putative protease
MEKEVGEITHYFDKIGVGIVKLAEPLKVGDRIHIVGGQRDFEQTVSSMQVEHAPVEEAQGGTEVGVKLDSEAKEGDKVYKVIE